MSAFGGRVDIPMQGRQSASDPKRKSAHSLEIRSARGLSALAQDWPGTRCNPPRTTRLRAPSERRWFPAG